MHTYIGVSTYLCVHTSTGARPTISYASTGFNPVSTTPVMKMSTTNPLQTCWPKRELYTMYFWHKDFRKLYMGITFSIIGIRDYPLDSRDPPPTPFRKVSLQMQISRLKISHFLDHKQPVQIVRQKQRSRVRTLIRLPGRHTLNAPNSVRVVCQVTFDNTI